MADQFDKAFPDTKKIVKALKSSVEAGGKEFTNQVKQGFAKQGTPGGDAWKPLSDDYLKWKQHQPGAKQGILTLFDHLRGAALSPQITPGLGDDQAQGGDSSSHDQAVYGESLEVDDIKANTHQFGRDPIEARPFFTVEGPAEQAVTDKSFKAFDKSLNS